MRPEVLKGRKGKQPDGTAKTREVKLGAVFTQHCTDAEGHPVRDYESTTYVGGYAPAAEFSLSLRAEARRRGVGCATQVVFLSDGALWAEDIARNCFTGCVSILDFYHACERLQKLAEALGAADIKAQVSRWKKLLLKDQLSTVIVQAQDLLPHCGEVPDNVQEHLGFLQRHQARMQYGTYRKNGWFIGSGVIEAGCKSVVGSRLKQSGMFWSEPGATSVLNFRTLLLSHRFDDFWTYRVNALSAHNDALAFSA